MLRARQIEMYISADIRCVILRLRVIASCVTAGPNAQMVLCKWP